MPRKRSWRSRLHSGSILSMLLAIMTHGCAFSESTRKATNDLTSLQSTDLNWSAAARRNDIEAIIEYWTDDAVIYPQGSAPIVGKEAIRKFIEQARSRPEFSISWTPEYVGRLSARDGYTAGSHATTIVDQQGNPTDLAGHYVSLWRKEGGLWRCYLECWNATPVGPR